MIIVIMMISRNRMLVAFRTLRREHAGINSRLEGSISGMRLTRAFANESFEIERFSQDNQAYMRAYQVAYKALGQANAMNNFFVQFMSVLVLICGAFLVLYERFSIGDMFAYYLYFGMLIAPIKRLMTMLETFQQGWAGFERFQELLDEPITIVDQQGALDLPADIRGTVVLDHVSFSYGAAKDRVLKDFSLTLEAGKMTALVGPSGVGKTTIAQLIPRFYERTGGRLTIDGYDIQSVTLNSLRSQIGYVQQDVFIFWGTIAENIAYGKPGASLDEIQNAAHLAGIHDFVIRLPKGYQTMVGERGVMLSGGQKQRISIARIFLKDPRILILDEATSALDNITEAYIQSSLEQLAKGRTVLVVAHRLTTVQNADTIIVMDKEGISQQGTHRELMEQEGHYKTLYEASQSNTLNNDFQS